MSRRSAEADDQHRVHCHLDELLERRGMTLVELAQRVSLSVVNLSVLKNDRARAVRFTTLTALCEALGCQPGEIFTVEPAPPPGGSVREPGGSRPRPR